MYAKVELSIAQGSGVSRVAEAGCSDRVCRTAKTAVVYVPQHSMPSASRTAPCLTPLGSTSEECPQEQRTPGGGQ